MVLVAVGYQPCWRRDTGSGGRTTACAMSVTIRGRREEKLNVQKVTMLANLAAAVDRGSQTWGVAQHSKSLNSFVHSCGPAAATAAEAAA